MKLTRLLFVCMVLLFHLVHETTTAQKSVEKLSLNEGTIENQFNYVIKKSNDYEDFKMVKSWWLYRLKTHVLDSMKIEKEKLSKSISLTVEKIKEIESLRATLQTTNDKLSLAVREKNNLVFLGITMNKATYNSIMWVLIAGLTVLLGAFVFLYRRSNAVTIQTKASLSELKEEYEDYRKRTLEREQKTVRKLYDEILKYKSKVTKV